MIGVDDLIAAGFREFSIPPDSHFHKLADRAFQRCIRDERGRKLYHVTAWVYDWTRFDRPVPKVTVMFEAWAYISEARNASYSITFTPGEGTTMVGVGEFFQRQWEALSGVPHESDCDIEVSA